MKNFYHQEKMKIVKNSNYNTEVFNLDIPATYGFKYYQRLDEKIREFFSRIQPTKAPILFRIIGDFTALEEADPEEKMYFTQAVINIFVNHMITDEKLDREQRLAPPKSLDTMDLSVLNKKGIVNRKIHFPEFSLEVTDKDGKIIYEVL